MQTTAFIIHPVFKEAPEAQKSHSHCAGLWSRESSLFSRGFSFLLCETKALKMLVTEVKIKIFLSGGVNVLLY